MTTVSRREFLRLGAYLAAGLGLSRTHVESLANGLERILTGQKRVLWLQGQSCSGCSVSLLNSEEPNALDVVTQMISVMFHGTISATQGDQAMETIARAIREKHYTLVLEGAVPAGMPDACTMGGKTLTSLLPDAIRNADLCIAAGTCAAFGGIPAAEGNETGAVSLGEYMKQQSLPTQQRLVNCPGCPVHPQSLVATLAYAAARGYPPVDPILLTPDMIYAHSVHDDCPRFHHWQKQVFARHFGDPGCLFKLGCLGPLSHTNCPQRQWNGGVNWCIRAGAPCIGCTSERFARQRTFSFYRKGEQYHQVDYDESDRQAGAP